MGCTVSRSSLAQGDVIPVNLRSERNLAEIRPDSRARGVAAVGQKIVVGLWRRLACPLCPLTEGRLSQQSFHTS